MKAYTITESTFAVGRTEKALSISRKWHSFDLNQIFRILPDFTKKI